MRNDTDFNADCVGVCTARSSRIRVTGRHAVFHVDVRLARHESSERDDISGQPGASIFVRRDAMRHSANLAYGHDTDPTSSGHPGVLAT